jgi:hypothetical protein
MNPIAQPGEPGGDVTERADIAAEHSDRRALRPEAQERAQQDAFGDDHQRHGHQQPHRHRVVRHQRLRVVDSARLVR